LRQKILLIQLLAVFRPTALSFHSNVSKYVRFALAIPLHFYLEKTDAGMSKPPLLLPPTYLFIC
jgi:hypothetical protein